MSTKDSWSEYGFRGVLPKESFFKGDKLPTPKVDQTEQLRYWKWEIISISRKKIPPTSGTNANEYDSFLLISILGRKAKQFQSCMVYISQGVVDGALRDMYQGKVQLTRLLVTQISWKQLTL